MTAEMCTPVGGVIDPSMFPVPTTDPGGLETLAASLRSDGSTLSGVGDDIKGAWAGLTSCYSAPEAETLFSVVDPVATDGESVETGMNDAANALETFAETVRGIQGRWATLETDANAFRESIEGDDDWKSAESWTWDWVAGNESPKVAEHQALLDRVDTLRQEFETAEITCANALNAGVEGRTRFVHGDGSEPGSGEFAHGFDGYLGDVDMAWGGPQETDHAWFVDVGHATWDFGVGAVEGLGGMLGMHSSEGWFEMSWGDALWEYHSESVQSAASLVGMYDTENGDWGWAGWDNVGDAWTDAAHAVVPWEEWGDRPWYVIGTAALNIGAMVGGAVLTATGLGAVVGVPLMAWRGSAMLNRMGGDRTPDADLSDADSPNFSVNLNLPRFAGGSRPLFSIDLPDLSSGGVSPSRISDMRGALDRLIHRNNELAGGDNGGSPTNSRTNSDDDSTATNNNRRNSGDDPDPTAQDLHDGMTVEDFLNPNSPDATRLRNELEGDFLEADVRSTRPRGDWEGSSTGRDGDRDGPETDREPALVGARPDTMDASATPDTPTNQRVDLTGSDQGSPDNRANGDGDGADMRDRNPTVTNSVDNTTRPGGTPSNGDGTNTTNNQNGQPDGSGTNTGDSANGNGSTTRPASNLPGDDGRSGGSDGSSGSDGGDPRDRIPRDADTRITRTEEVRQLLGLDANTKWTDFASGFTDLLNDRPDLLHEFYDKGGARRSVDIKIDGHTIPVLTRTGDSGPWFAKENLATPDKPPYLTDDDGITVRADPNDPRVSHLNDLAGERQRAIDADQLAEKELSAKREEHKDHPGPGPHPDVAEADRAHKPAHKLMGETSEGFGERVAELATREQFDGNHTITLKDGTEMELPKVVGDGPVVQPSGRPGSGAHQFDQIWRTEDGGIVIVEAKSSTSTELGERTVDSNGEPKRVSQGSREYLDDIVREMEKRGKKDQNRDFNEQTLAQEILDALKADKLHYVEVHGMPEASQYGGYTFNAFDVSD